MIKCEIRADNTLHIEGYVNAVERDSDPLNVPNIGKCVEQIRAGAFGASLASGGVIEILENHDHSRKLGSTADGNLTLQEDAIGLRASADITDSEIISKARTGQLKGWSFGFTPVDTEIEERAGNIPRRIVKALKLSEVSLIDGNYKPCYRGTLVEVRADGMVEFRCDEDVEIVGSRAVNHAADLEFYRRRVRLHELELRYNPYHDPSNGRFCSGGGGGGGNVIYVAKGNKGQYAEDKEEYGKDMAILLSNPDYYFKIAGKYHDAKEKYFNAPDGRKGSKKYEKKQTLAKEYNKWSPIAGEAYERYGWGKGIKVNAGKGLKLSIDAPNRKTKYKLDHSRYRLQGQMSFEGLR